MNGSNLQPLELITQVLVVVAVSVVQVYRKALKSYCLLFDSTLPYASGPLDPTLDRSTLAMGSKSNTINCSKTASRARALKSAPRVYALRASTLVQADLAFPAATCHSPAQKAHDRF